MSFTYNDQDEKRILDSIQDPVKRRLVEMLFYQASTYGPGLSEAEFNEVKELAK